MGSTSQLVPSLTLYIHKEKPKKIKNKNGSKHSLHSLSMLLLAGSATAESDVFHVTGSVLCQECCEGWNEWVNGANPIQGSKVSVTCLDERSREVHYASDLTDEAGNFDVACKKYVNGNKLNPQNCYARLVWSPGPVCNVETNFAGGKSGVKLHRLTFCIHVY